MNGLNTTEIWVFLLIYLLPILFFIYTGTDVMLRNSKKVEHRLLCLTAIVYVLLFLEEYMRHLLPISHSAAMVAYWFSNVGIIMPGLGFHFLAKFARMDKLMPRYYYPIIFYLPLLVIIVNVMSSKEIISSSEFVQVGLWKYPVYNMEYYIALTVSIGISSLYLVVLFMGRKHVNSQEHSTIFKLLIWAVTVCTCWHVLFGYVQFRGILPPYPYIFGGVIWCSLLRLAMIRYDFLNFETKRYEKLFNLNPAAILLVELSGSIKEANPSARQLFNHMDLDQESFHSIVNKDLQMSIQNKREIKDYETFIHNGSQRVDVLIDGDYVSVDNEPHMILIARDITEQKEIQEEIRYLAYHDPLTRLPNRRSFYESLNEAIQEAEENRQRLTVILIDLDLFKDTNDRYGHEAGDEVLRHTARLIQEVSDPIGVAARLGGDEFVMFIRDTTSELVVEETIELLQRKFSEGKLNYRGQMITIQMSIGASVYPENGADVDTLMRSADKAMYEAKRSRHVDLHVE